MMVLCSSFLFSLSLLLPCVTATTSVADLGSDLTILTDNDLLHNASTRTGAGILLSQASTFDTATKSCAQIGERLWSPGLQNFDSGLNTSLSYQKSLRIFPSSQLFWIARENPRSCRSIDFTGNVHTISCAKHLPTICTQSAPLSNATYANTLPPFQISLTTNNQTLLGYRDFHSFRFLGVRFAPQPQRYTYSTVYTGPSNASALLPGPECPQPGIPGSEDCLFLNIWIPFLPSPASREEPKKLKAVLVWIFGGGFVTGSPNTSGGDGGNFASRGDVVVVGINYRLGNLGLLALNDGVTNGNYGIQDSITALQWIRGNVAAFGGDRDRITVMGQSSGAAAVRALLASEVSRGLFGGAIMHSNPAGFSAFAEYSMYQSIEEEMELFGTSILNQTGCLGVESEVGCLRGVDANVLVNLPVVANYPVIDGTYLASPNLSFTTSSSTSPPNNKPKPLLLGTVRDEFAITVPYPAPSNLTLAISQLSSLLSLDLSSLPTNPAFSPFLPSTRPPTQDEIFNFTQSIVTLGGLKCLNLATAYSASLPRPNLPPATKPLFDKDRVFLFGFNRTYQPPSFTSPPCVPAHGNPGEEEYFKCHAGEVTYVFGNVAREGMVDRDGFDTAFEREIVDLWAGFVRGGDVNSGRGEYGVWDGRVEGERWDSVGSGGVVRGAGLQWRVGGGKGVVKMGDEVESVRGRCEALGLGIDYYEK